MPFYLSDNKMTYEMPYCDEPRILTILQKETTILVPYGPVKVIVAYIKAKNSNTGNVYYFNPDLGVVKLEQNYSEVTKKAEYIYQLSKVK